MTDPVYVSFPIYKSEKTPEGDLLVYGKCTDGSVDQDHQIVDSKWSAKALTDWLAVGGNVRVQHSPFLYPAGKGLELEIDRDGDSGHWLKALVAKSTPAFDLVEKKILKDFSIGILDPQIVHNNHMAPGGTIVGGIIGEVSLVDRGSNKNTQFTIAKSAPGGGIEWVAKMTGWSPMARMSVTKKKRVDSGGRDVSDVPDSDFAGPGHTFPLKTPADVPDAASLAHHAKDPAQVRANIKRIARRKFGEDTPMPPSLADKTVVPDTVKEDEDPGADNDCGVCHGSGKIRDGNVRCPECQGSGGKNLRPAVLKGDAAEDYPGDKDTDDDSPADYNAGDGDDDADDDKASKKALKRARRRAALKAAQRGNNGGRAPSEVEGHADPDAAEDGFAPAKGKTMVPAGKHREPDGAQAEGIEEDAGMHSSDESGDKTGVPGSSWHATKSAPSAGMARMHDVLCPYFKVKSALKSWGLPAGHVEAAIPVREIESLAMDAILKGSLAEAGYFTEMLGLISSIQHIGPDVLIDARKALPTMFPTAHPHQQTDIRPSQFQGGYQSAGRPPLTASGSSEGSKLPAAHVHEVSASDFRRGFLSGGRASESPGEGTQARASTAAFGQALTTLGELHARVSNLWPDMCPLNLTMRDYTSGEGATGIRPASMPSLPAAPGQNKAVEVKLRKALAAKQATIAELEEEVSRLGSLPDPEQAPYRGLPQLGGPVDRESYVSKALGNGGAETEADNEEAEFLEFMSGLAGSGNPAMRLGATKAIRMMLTK